MYIIPLAWIYVTLMMAVAEATNSNGSVLGAIVTFVLYGVLPVGLILYFMGTPARRRALQARELSLKKDSNQPALNQPNTSSLPTTDAVAPVRKEGCGIGHGAPRRAAIIAINKGYAEQLQALLRQST